MISKSQIKLITSLQQKKHRNKLGLFVAEGPKVIQELFEAGLEIEALYVADSELFTDRCPVIISDKELAKISFLKNANNAIAVFKIIKKKKLSDENLTVVLDAIRDPGNLGTIIRLCDWFGVEQLVCSEDTVDCYNPKVIQATMGSISRVNVSYVDLSDYLNETNLPIYVGLMNGENIYKQKLAKKAIIVLGNEANGVSENILKIATNKITIPRFGNLQKTESLNVATATAILLSEFKRTIEL